MIFTFLVILTIIILTLIDIYSLSYLAEDEFNRPSVMSTAFTTALLALVPIGTKGDVVASLGGTGIAVMSIVAIMGFYEQFVV